MQFEFVLLIPALKQLVDDHRNGYHFARGAG